MSLRHFAFVFSVAPVLALAQVTPIGPFSGSSSDGYETQPRGQFLASYDIFGGAGSVDMLGSGQGLHITTGWTFFNSIFPHSGEVFMGGAGVNYSFMFDTPAFQFGGYFGTNTDAPDAMATFYDAQGSVIGSSMPVSAPIGQWSWNGWEYSGGISRIDIVASNSWGGFIMSDDIEYNPVPEPAAIIGIVVGLSALLLRKRK
jgi:hypothetical protein